MLSEKSLRHKYWNTRLAMESLFALTKISLYDQISINRYFSRFIDYWLTYNQLRDLKNKYRWLFAYEFWGTLIYLKYKILRLFNLKYYGPVSLLVYELEF